MSVFKNEDLVVAQKSGSRLLLVGGPRSTAQFEGPSERTLFFSKGEVENELKRLKIPMAAVKLRSAEFRMTVS